MRYFDRKNHCCSQCEMLMDEKSFDNHPMSECFMIEMKNLKLEKERERNYDSNLGEGI